MRNKIIAGNWKMNLTLTESKQWIDKVKDGSKIKNLRILIIPPFTNLDGIKTMIVKQNSKIEIASQNVHHAVSGAYTGEISASMLKDLGINTVLIGHSERRTLFAENQDIVFQKAYSALNQHMEIIFCIGESLSERNQGLHFDIIKNQLVDLIHKLDIKFWQSNKIILAYEPVWAIGTGRTATAFEAQQMHQYIRQLIQKSLGEQIANQSSILYGGSIKPSNATNLFQQKDVDGGLVGGASLEVDGFNAIIKSSLNFS